MRVGKIISFPGIHIGVAVWILLLYDNVDIYIYIDIANH